jgi:MFS family permease
MAAYFLTGFMGSAMVVAVPSIGFDLHMSVTLTGWVISSFVLASAVFLMPAGKYADNLGYSSVFFTGLITFFTSTTLCAFAWSGNALVVFRFLQGIAAALVYCSGMALVSSVYAPEERGKAIGMVSSTVYVGLSVGPVVGGALNTAFGWRSILFFVSFLSLAVITIASRFLEKTEGTGKAFKDYTGMLLFMVMVLLIFGGLSASSAEGCIAFAVGLLVMSVMVFYEYRHPDPLIDVRLFFGNKPFGFANAASMMNYSSVSGVLFLVSMDLHLNHGLTSEKAGLVMLAQPLVMAFVAPFAGRLADRSDPGGLAFTGMAVIAAVLAFMSYTVSGMSVPLYAVSLACLGFGIGLFTTPNNTVIMNSVEKRHYGFAASTLSTMRLMGQTFSIALSVIILNMLAGSAEIETMSAEGLTSAVRITFIIFTCICVLGAFMSLTGKKISSRGRG